MNREKQRRKPRRDPTPEPIRGLPPCGCHKRRFATEPEAQAAALRVSRYVGPLRVYPCPRMKGFHLTRLREWKGSS